MLITQSTKLCFHIWCDSKKPSTSPLLMIFSSKESLLVLAELSFFSLDTTSMTGLFILILFLTTTACLKKKVYSNSMFNLLQVTLIATDKKKIAILPSQVSIQQFPALPSVAKYTVDNEV